MSGTSSSKAGISRRSFVKGAAAAGALGVAAGGMTATSSWLAPAKAFAEGEDQLRYTPHLFHCGGNCALECTVRDGRMVNINPRKMPEERFRKQCLRAVGEIPNTYSVDRIQTPMRRVGERGEGKFEQISWDEAVEAIATAFREAQEKYGKDAVFIKKTIEALNSHGFNYIPTYIGCQTEALSGIDRSTANGVVPAMMNPQGLANNSIYEWPEADIIINIGDNLVETSITWSEAFALAQESGAKIITIDPRFCATAGKSDQWISVIPGQDLALFLGVLNAIIDNGWYDEEFSLAYTSMPHLVDIESGALLGGTEVWKNPISSKEVDARIPMVWDTVTGAAVPYTDEAAAPALEGEFEVDGKKAITQFSLLKKQIAEYTPAWASEMCGVDEQIIVDLADEYSHAGNAIVNWGMGGADKFTNADLLGHTLAVLQSITGNFGRAGTGLGAYCIGGGVIAQGTVAAWPAPEGFAPAEHPVPFFDMPQKENNVHAVMFWGDVPFLQRADANKTAEWLKSLDFVAVAEIYNSTVVKYADIVVPSTSRFECSEDWKAIRIANGCVHLQQKVLDPMFEAKDDLEIERLILSHWGYDQYLPETYEQLARHNLTKTSANIEGVTFEQLVENNGMVPLHNFKHEAAGYHTPKVNTHTGKAELYYESLIGDGLAFPAYEAPNEAYAGNPLMEKYPLIFIQGKTRFRMHSYLSSASWFWQMFEPSLMLHPTDADARGLKEGDEVRVFNDRGEFVTKVTVDETVRPGTAFMVEESFSQYYKEGLLQNVTNCFMQPRAYKMIHGAQVPYNDTLVEIQKA